MQIEPYRLVQPSIDLNTSSLVPEFIGSPGQVRIIENMDSKDKRQYIKLLSPLQRRNLSPQLIELFYKGFPKEEIKINTQHFTKTLEVLPALPTIHTKVKMDELIELFDEIKLNQEELLKELAKKDQEVKNVDRFKDGLLNLIKTVNNLENPSRTVTNLNSGSDEEEKSDNEEHHRDAMALKTLIVNIVHLIRESNLALIEKIEYLRDMAAGGLHCDRGQFIQTYKVYMKLIKFDTPEKTLLKFLHDTRDNIVDLISTQKPDNSSETIEVKSELIESFGKEIGLLTAPILKGEEKEALDYSKLKERNYVNALIERWKETGMNQNQIDFMMEVLKKEAAKWKTFLNQFYSHYTPDSLIKLISEQSKEWDLYQWFLSNPKNEFKDRPNDQSDYVLNHIVDRSLFVKEEYVMQMLDEIGVLSF